MYPLTEAAEHAMFEAIATASDLYEFRKRLFAGNLHVKIATALVKDQEAARLKHYIEIKETVRSSGPKSFLDNVSNTMT